MKTLVSPDDQRKFFGAKNLFRLAADNFHHLSAIYDCLEGVLTDIEIKSMIQEKDSNGNNFLHLICQNSGDEYVLVEFFKVLEDVLDADELKIFLTSSN